jgi:hypothetical protein
MGISWRRHDRAASAAATSRWTQTAETVTERFQSFHELPLDEAVAAAMARAPGNMSREELTMRIAASREVEPPQG